MNYDDWKLATPPEYELGEAPDDEPACDCGQPLEGSEGSLCVDCARERRDNEIIKRCGCGRVHTREGWGDLDYVGVWHVPADETGPEERLELRNCPCGSTISIEVAS